METWSGVPMKEAVRRLGANRYGDSQLMFGIRNLTLRVSRIDVFAETENVTVCFSTGGKQTESVTIAWSSATMFPEIASMMASEGA